jgi:dTDP-4-amino-4,6-dideoxygalactose transaminase
VEVRRAKIAVLEVPLFDPANSIAGLRPRLDSAIRAVLDRGVYVLGPELEAFELEFARYLGVRHVIGVGNGTDALTITLRAMGIGPGDDVVVPSFTFYASAEAIPPTGAHPVFCDIDLETYCVTAETVRAALTPRTKAVIAVDLFGNPVPIDELQGLGIPILEDAAQAAGARLDGRPAGSLGHAATFSFYPSKNLAAFGDAGAVATDDDQLAERVRLLRSHGSRDKSTFEAIGVNTRLDELQAALLRVLLPELDAWAEGRREAGRRYADAGLADVVLPPRPVEGAEPAWHLYAVRHPDIEAIADALRLSGIGARAYYRTPIHRQPAMRAYVSAVDLPATDEAADTHLAIPMSPTLSRPQAEAVVAAMRGVGSTGRWPGRVAGLARRS